MNISCQYFALLEIESLNHQINETVKATILAARNITKPRWEPCLVGSD